MTNEAMQADTRGQKILWKAIEAFGRHGIRGASLRDIAREAGVSLTLISHHFGNKPGLVSAAVASLADCCAPALATLKMTFVRCDRPSARVFVEAWIGYLLAAFGSRDAAAYLPLMWRLRTDPSLDESLRFTLDVAEPELRRALQLTFPHAPDASIDFVLRSSRIVLLTTLAGDDASSGDDTPDVRFDADMLVKYLASAIEAALEAPSTCSLLLAGSAETA